MTAPTKVRRDDEVTIDLRECPSCGARHRTWASLTRCLYPRARGVYDDDGGPWVAVHQMRQPADKADSPYLTLFPTRVAAEESLRGAHPDERPCCGSCAKSMWAGRRSLYVARVGDRIFGASPFKAWRKR